MGGEEEQEISNLEEEVFKALDHQTRRDILRYIGEKKDTTFTEIMNGTRIPDSPTISYHLRILAPFIELQDGKYDLTPIGKAAYTLLLRTVTYNRVALLQKRKYEAILGNTILWVAAIAAAAYLEADTFLTTIILPVAAAVSSIITYQLFE